jgi:predicted cupin superfamily sugar epimerase
MPNPYPIDDADTWIAALNLHPHPEGGHYRQVYRSRELLEPRGRGLPARFTSPKAISTAIYFLLKGDEVSAFHRIKSDELWHLYAGSPLDIHVLHEDGELQTLSLGLDIAAGQRPFHAVPAGVWFGAMLTKPDSYALVGCTVAPGFDFEDFELAEREGLLEHYPEHHTLIKRLTRE